MRLTQRQFPAKLTLFSLVNPMKRQANALEIMAALRTDRWFGRRSCFSACWFVAILGLFFCVVPSNLAAQGPELKHSQKDYAQEYFQSFKGKPGDMHHFKIIGEAEADKRVTFEPDGLRITLPPGYKGRRPGTGVELLRAVKGDFEITVNFELLKEPEPTGSWGTRVSLGFVVNVPEFYDGSVSQKIDGKGKKQFFTYLATPAMGTNKAQTRTNTFPNTAKTGRLRLVRTGSALSFYASPGFDNDFTLLKEYPFLTTDLKYVYISTATNDPKEDLDVRITDLRLRADSFQDEPVLASDPPPRRSALWWVAGLGIALPLIFGGLFLWRRRKHTAEGEPTKALE